MIIQSPSFEQGEKIPSKYTCDGEDINPPLLINDVPEGTQSLVLIFENYNSSSTRNFIHWLVINIDPGTKEIKEGAVPEKGIQLMNSFGSQEYNGPRSLSDSRNYHFKLYALDKVLDVVSSAKIKEVEAAMEGHILEEAKLEGVYSR